MSPTTGSAETLAEAVTYLPICGPCVRGEGSECHTPECALFLRDVPPDGLIAEFALDLERHDAEVRAEALREFARKWADWAANGSPQVRGGAAYRAVCEAQRIENPALTEGDDRG